MSKVYTIVFNREDTDLRLLRASLSALESEVLAARYGHTLEFNYSTDKFTLKWWRKPEGGFDGT